MIYLIWYLAIGAGILAAGLISRLIARKDASELWHDMCTAFYPEPETPHYRILNYFVAPPLIIALMVAVWPFGVGVLVVGWFEERRFAAMDEESKRTFAVTLRDLREQLSIMDIEKRERVIDPLGAVPDLPFGHLHCKWKQFLKGVGPDDAIWSFAANWKPTWGPKEFRSGYVVVGSGGIGPYYLTILKTFYGE